MTDGGRFQDSGKKLAGFGGEYLVQCPKCDEPAQIKDGRLSCGNCGLSLTRSFHRSPMRSDTGHYYEHVDTKNWFGDVTPRAKMKDRSIPPRCRSCNGEFTKLSFSPRPKTANLPRSLHPKCSHCGAPNTIEIGWHPFLTPDQPRDPVFGCKLLLQKDFKEGTLYAYNTAHAEEYLSYIEADHRGRPPTPGSSSFFTKLPARIKSAKNRDDVAQSLCQMIELAEKQS